MKQISVCDTSTDLLVDQLLEINPMQVKSYITQLFLGEVKHSSLSQKRSRLMASHKDGSYSKAIEVLIALDMYKRLKSTTVED